MSSKTRSIDVPRQKLVELLQTHGLDILEDTERCRSWLRYSCPEHKREVNVLLCALDQRVPQDLVGPVSEQSLVRRLVDDFALVEEAARWAVNCWAEAVSIHKSNSRLAQPIQAIGKPIVQGISDYWRG